MANSLYNIALDFSKELNYAKAIMARQGDKGVTVEVTPFLNGLAFPTSGVTFTLKATTPSGKYVDSKGTVSSGIVKFSLDGTFMSESGYYRNCYVEASTSTQTLTTQDIIFFSLGVSDISQGQGKEYISRLEQLIEQYNKTFDSFMKEIADDAKDIQTQLTNMNNQAKALQTQLDELKAALAALDFQKQKLTRDDGKSLRLADLNPRPATIDDLTRPGFYYITSAESNTFIPADHYIRQISMAGSGWIVVYPGDAGGVVVQEWYRNTASAVANTRHLYRKQESTSPISWNPWSEYAQTNSTMLSSSYYQGAAHRLAEATATGKQATSYLELSENSGIYYLTTNESKAMTDFSSLPTEFIYGTYIENIPNSSLGNYFQKITSNILDGKAQLPVSYWRIVVKTDSGYDATKWRKYVSQDDAQMYKTTKDNGDSWRLEDLPTRPDGLEQWARLYKGWYYIPNSSLKTMSDYSTLPVEFANAHVHMEIQGGAGSVYARQTLTMYQAPYTQIYRVVTNTLAQPWQTVAMKSDLDAERPKVAVARYSTADITDETIRGRFNEASWRYRRVGDEVRFYGRFNLKAAYDWQNIHKLPVGFRLSADFDDTSWNVPLTCTKIQNVGTPDWVAEALVERQGTNLLRFGASAGGNVYVAGSWYTDDPFPTG